MGKIVDVEEVQDALNRAARDAKHDPSDVRAGRFVHRDARDDRFVAGRDKDKPRSGSAPARRGK